MKSAFTLIELIFVIVIIGILAKVGFSYSKVDYLQKDAQYLLLKIKETRYRSIGAYRQNGHCISLDKTTLNAEEQTKLNPYTFKVDIATNISLDDDKICFDEFGRVYKNNTASSNYLLDILDINLTLREKSCLIKVFPITGYGIISCG